MAPREDTAVRLIATPFFHIPGQMAGLREALVKAHEADFGDSSDLLVGLQLTHAGRFSRPNEKARLEPLILYRHPILDRKFGLAPDGPVMTDDERSQQPLVSRLSPIVPLPESTPSPATNGTVTSNVPSLIKPTGGAATPFRKAVNVSADPGTSVTPVSWSDAVAPGSKSAPKL